MLPGEVRSPSSNQDGRCSYFSANPTPRWRRPRIQRIGKLENGKVTDLAGHTNRDIGLVLIAHGSRRAEANDDLHRVADSLRRRGFPHVFPSFLELAEPTILAAGTACAQSGVRLVVLLPYFLSAGKHVVDDLESARCSLAKSVPTVEFRLADPLGPHSLLENILIERLEACRDRAGASPDKYSSRLT